jgi:hypothetical protein
VNSSTTRFTPSNIYTFPVVGSSATSFTFGLVNPVVFSVNVAANTALTLLGDVVTATWYFTPVCPSATYTFPDPSTFTAPTPDGTVQLPIHPPVEAAYTSTPPNRDTYT